MDGHQQEIRRLARTMTKMDLARALVATKDALKYREERLHDMSTKYGQACHDKQCLRAEVVRLKQVVGHLDEVVGGTLQNAHGVFVASREIRNLRRVSK